MADKPDTYTDSIGKWTRTSRDGAAIECWSCEMNDRTRKALTVDRAAWDRFTAACERSNATTRERQSLYGVSWLWREFSLNDIWKWLTKRMRQNASNANRGDCGKETE